MRSLRVALARFPPIATLTEIICYRITPISSIRIILVLTAKFLSLERRAQVFFRKFRMTGR